MRRRGALRAGCDGGQRQRRHDEADRMQLFHSGSCYRRVHETPCLSTIEASRLRAPTSRMVSLGLIAALVLITLLTDVYHRLRGPDDGDE